MYKGILAKYIDFSQQIGEISINFNETKLHIIGN